MVSKAPSNPNCSNLLGVERHPAIWSVKLVWVCRAEYEMLLQVKAASLMQTVGVVTVSFLFPVWCCTQLQKTKYSFYLELQIELKEAAFWWERRLLLTKLGVLHHLWDFLQWWHVRCAVTSLCWGGAAGLLLAGWASEHRCLGNSTSQQVDAQAPASAAIAPAPEGKVCAGLWNLITGVQILHDRRALLQWYFF